MSERNRPSDPPAFDSAFGAEDVEQRIYGRILQAREPTTAAEIAEDVGCDPKTARKYLSWFAELGVVEGRDGGSTAYQRNDAYFEWRRVHDLASTHSVDELQSRVSELTERIAAYRETYDAETPAEVDVLEFDASRVDDVYEDLGDWATVERERRRFERARQQAVDPTARSHS